MAEWSAMACWLERGIGISCRARSTGLVDIDSLSPGGGEDHCRTVATKLLQATEQL